MKKFAALLLAMLLVLVNVAALAEGFDDLNSKIDNLKQGASEGGDPHFTKTYTTNVDGIVPTETLTFTVTPSEKNPDDTPITVGTDNEVAVSAETTTIPVNVPAASATAFTLPGEYTYTVQEVAGSSQASTYDDTEITVKVYVIYVEGELTVLGTNVYTEIKEDVKVDEITNEYEVGDLTVSKTIDGNLADAELEFTFEVTLTPTSGKTVNSDITVSGSGTASATEGGAALDTIDKAWDTAQTFYVTVKGGQNVKFENIPTGVTYNVKETKAGDADIERIADDNATQIDNANNAAAYTVTGDEEGDGATGTISTDASEVEITNYKGVEIPTGIALDTVPYILILAVAMMGVVLAVRKREEY